MLGGICDHDGSCHDDDDDDDDDDGADIDGDDDDDDDCSGGLTCTKGCGGLYLLRSSLSLPRCFAFGGLFFSGGGTY